MKIVHVCGSEGVGQKLRIKIFTKSRVFLFCTTLPFVVILFLFAYLPLFGWSYAFVDYKPGIPILRQAWVGLKFFRQMFIPVNGFLSSLADTLAMSALNLIVTPLPVIFALMLAEVRNRKLSRLIQTISSIPNFISWILVYAISFAFFSNDGILNTLLEGWGVISTPTNILANANAAWFYQTANGIWKGIGWSAILYIAALSGVDQELYEAAEIDGAGRFKKAIHISVPGLLPTYTVLLLLGISAILSNGFDQYYVFGNPMVIQKLQVIDVYVYNYGIGSMQYAYATAVGIFKSVISITLLFGANAAMKKTTGRSIT